MSTERFNVVLEGTTLLGHEPTVVKAKLATLIKRDVEFAARLLGGQSTTLKSGVDAVTGERYVSALRRAGVAAQLEPESLEIDAELSVFASISDERQEPVTANVPASPFDPASTADHRPTPIPAVAPAVSRAEHVAADGTLGGDIHRPKIVRPSSRRGSATMDPRLNSAKKLFFIALTIDIAVTAVSAIGDFWAVGVVKDINNDMRAADQSTISTLEAWNSFSKVMLLTLICVGISLVGWLRACYEYAKETLKVTGFVQEGWKVWGWILPFANLFKPYQVLGEIYRAGDTDYIAGDGWKEASGSVMLLVWWIFWVITHLIMLGIGRQTSKLASLTDPTLDQLITIYNGSITICILSLLVAGSWFIVANSLTERLLWRPIPSPSEVDTNLSVPVRTNSEDPLVTSYESGPSISVANISTQRQETGLNQQRAAEYREAIRSEPRTESERLATLSNLFLAVRLNRLDDVTWTAATYPESMEATDSDGRTPLHIAVEERNLPMVTALLDLGADPRLTNNDGASALDIAMRMGTPAIVAELQNSLQQRGSRPIGSRVPAPATPGRMALLTTADSGAKTSANDAPARWEIDARKSRMAAAEGDAVAQNNLGSMYFNGWGVPQDYVEAARWYRKAADQGLAQAQRNLGSMYFNGQGLPQDLVRAHKWLSFAASGFSVSEVEQRNGAVKMCGIVAAKMTPDQLAKAQRLAREWKRTK